jgi:hypothetical protein
LLQESNAAQPQILDQPLQPAADPAVPATEWVNNLRNELPSVSRQDFPELEALYGEDFVQDHGLQLNASHDSASAATSGLATSIPASENIASLVLDDVEPSAVFQEDVAFLQNPHEADALFESETWIPPPLPLEPACDG